jgi:hypothetical protein
MLCNMCMGPQIPHKKSAIYQMLKLNTCTYYYYYYYYYYNNTYFTPSSTEQLNQRRSGCRWVKWLGKCLSEVAGLEVILKGSDRSRLLDSIE